MDFAPHCFSTHFLASLQRSRLPCLMQARSSMASEQLIWVSTYFKYRLYPMGPSTELDSLHPQAAMSNTQPWTAACPPAFYSST